MRERRRKRRRDREGERALNLSIAILYFLLSPKRRVSLSFELGYM